MARRHLYGRARGRTGEDEILGARVGRKCSRHYGEIEEGSGSGQYNESRESDSETFLLLAVREFGVDDDIDGDMVDTRYGEDRYCQIDTVREVCHMLGLRATHHSYFQYYSRQRVLSFGWRE